MECQSTTSHFPDHFSLQASLRISPSYVDDAKEHAYRFYRAGRLADSAVVCRGLLAIDDRDAWVRALYAAVLRRQREFHSAGRQVDLGLHHAAHDPTLTAMRKEIAEIVGRLAGAGSSPEQVSGRPCLQVRR